jgi:hypothetical protein
LVPARWKEDKQLAHWVAAQRQMYKKEKLDEDQISKLYSIGFVWDSRQKEDALGVFI